jgi:hypothetical protein
MIAKVAQKGAPLGVGALLEIDPTGNFALYDGGGEVRIAGTSGKTTVVVNDGSLGRTVAWAWSPDGKYLAYGYTLTGGQQQLDLVASDGSSRQTLHTDCHTNLARFHAVGLC